jgi:hypothetical protein
VTDNVRKLAAIRASELGRSISDYIETLVEQDAERAGLATYLARQTKEEACHD